MCVPPKCLIIQNAKNVHAQSVRLGLWVTRPPDQITAFPGLPSAPEGNRRRRTGMMGDPGRRTDRIEQEENIKQ